MKRLSGSELSQYHLNQHNANWCAAEIDVPSSAAVIDFVLSDREERSWDNNSNQVQRLNAGSMKPAFTNERLYQHWTVL